MWVCDLACNTTWYQWTSSEDSNTAWTCAAAMQKAIDQEAQNDICKQRNEHLLICYTRCAHPVIDAVPVDGVVDQVQAGAVVECEGPE